MQQIKSTAVSAFFLVLLVLATQSQARILLHSDFESGRAYIAETITKGQERIELVESQRVDQWALSGGTGTVTDEFTGTTNAFQYLSRRGNTLHGVTGIKRSFGKWSTAQTASLFPWSSEDLETKTVRPTMENAIFGNGSVRFFTSSDSAAQMFLGIPQKMDTLVIRFYVEFSQEFIDAKRNLITVLSPAYFHAKLPKLRFIRSGELSRPSLRLVHSKDHMENWDHGSRFIPKPDIPYCIEYQAAPVGSDSVWTRLLIDEQIESEYIFYRDSVGPMFDSWRVFAGKPGGRTPGHYTMDEFAISDRPIGPLPQTPVVLVEPISGRLCLSNAPLDPGIHGCQWHVADALTSWMVPRFNSGRVPLGCIAPYMLTPQKPRLQHGFYPCTIPTGLKAGIDYKARCRIQKSSGTWSPWSRPVAYSIPSSAIDSVQWTKPGPVIEKLCFVPPDEKDPVPVIHKGAWYNLQWSARDPKGPAHLGYIEVWVNPDPGAAVNTYENRGDAHIPGRNYLFSFSMPDHRVHVKAKENSPAWTRFTGGQNDFADATPANLVMDREEGKGSIRFRMPQNAITGPVLLRAFAANLDWQLSPIHSELVFLKEALPVRVDRRNYAHILAIAGTANLVLLLLGALLIMNYRARLQKHGKGNRIGTHGETPGDIAPLAFDSPYDEHIKKARDFIMEKYGTPITTRDVAEHLNVSSDWLMRLFKKGTGTTVNSYINVVRIENAKKLLLETKQGITEIAFQTGFGSLDHFEKTFRKAEGISPKKFREAKR